MTMLPWLSPETPPYETDFSPLRQPSSRTPRTRLRKLHSNLAVSSCFPPSLDVLIIAPFARVVKSFYKKIWENFVPCEIVPNHSKNLVSQLSRKSDRAAVVPGYHSSGVLPQNSCNGQVLQFCYCAHNFANSKRALTNSTAILQDLLIHFFYIYYNKNF